MADISPQTIRALLAELELEDPVDFEDLPVDENAARNLVVGHLAELREKLVADEVSGEMREALLLAAASRVILENLLLHVRALLGRAGHSDDEVAALFAKLGVGRPRS
jgi:hypothetical protein